MAFALSHSQIGVGFVAGLVRRWRGNRRQPAAMRAYQVSDVASAQSSLKPAHRAPLTGAEQWSRLTQILSGASAGVHSAQRLQDGATQKLDLADYGLTTLIDELSAVMTVPGRKSRQSTVHVMTAAVDPDLTRTRSANAATALAA